MLHKKLTTTKNLISPSRCCSLFIGSCSKSGKGTEGNVRYKSKRESLTNHKSRYGVVVFRLVLTPTIG
jgi:hypothetical protein